MRNIHFLVLSTLMVANTSALGQVNCNIVDECAKAAMETALAAQKEAQSLRKDLDELKAIVAAEEKSNVVARNVVQVLIDNSAKKPSVGTEIASRGSSITTVSCANGEYLVGMNFHWTGTCERKCDGDGPILRWVAPVCRKIQN